MKKLLVILVAGAFASCGNGSSTTKSADTAAIKTDTSMNKMDSAPIKIDTTIKH